MGRMAKRSVDHERRDTGSRRRRGFATFVGHWTAAFLVFVLAAALRLIININGWLGGDPTVPYVTVVAVTVCTLGLALRAGVVGRELGRKSVFYKHVQLTIVGAGAIVLWIAIWGFSVTRVLLVVLALGAGALSWNMHRTDALRADPREEDGGRDGGWGEIFGVPNSRVTNVRRTDHAVTATVVHGKGETYQQVAAALPKIESAAGAVAGRGRVVRGERADTSEVTVMTSDPFTDWLFMSGLSHPGGSFADPITTSYFDTGEPERYWFPAGETAGGQYRAAHHRGRMGMTGSGKSGEAKIEIAEVLSRRDVVVLYTDPIKGEQGAGGLLHFFTCFADTASKGKMLFRAVNALVLYRADLMGQHGYTDWSPEVYEKLGLPAVYYFIDEADQLINTDAFKSLATTARSVGVFLSVTLPRADSTAMPTTARYSLGAWKCFGVGDDYSAGFALTEDTRKAGAAPENWRVAIPGAHYHDTAPGVPPQMWAVPLRSYRVQHGQLAQWVADARAQFAPAQFTPEEIEILNRNGAYAACRPEARRAVTGAPPAPAQGADEDADDDLAHDAQGADDDNGEGADMDDEDRIRVPESISKEDLADYAREDPRTPIKRTPGPDVEFDDGVPQAVSEEEMIAEFNRVVVEIANEGITVLRNRDLLDRCQIWHDWWVSRRLSRVCTGAAISPPGIRLERVEGKAGHFTIIREPELVALGNHTL
jgi:hypothetical protein